MKLTPVKISPEIRLYYFNQEPNRDLVATACQIFTGSVKPFKTKHRHQVYMFEHNTDIYYAKKFSPSTFEQKISYYFRPSKAVNCLKISNRLRTANFKVVETVFALNYQKGMKLESIIVTKKNDGIDIKDFLSSNIDNAEKEIAFNCLISTLGNFYKNGFLHYDPILTNFFINPTKKPYEIIFLDFDSITYSRWVSTKRTFDVLSKFFYFVYTFSIKQNKEQLYSRDKALFYLDVFLKLYNPKIIVDKAFKYLTKGTVKLLKRKDKLSIKNKTLLSRLIDLYALK